MANQEKFKTAIGGQALIEGIMMRGPKKDAIVVRKGEELDITVTDRKLPPEKSIKRWPLIRGAVNFFDAQVTGVKALMHSADLSPEENQEEQMSKFDRWLEKKMGEAKFQKYLIGAAVALGLGMSIVLFILLPAFVNNLLSNWLSNDVILFTAEGVVRILIFLGYMFLCSRLKDMRRVFAYHGAEHKTIRCYEAGLPLTVENVRGFSCLHPRCGTSFLFVVVILSILLFSLAVPGLQKLVPALAAMKGTFLYKLILILFRLLLLPLIVSIAYEINRFVGRHDNWFTKILTAPGMWLQYLSTNEPEDDMIEVAITALEAVIPQEEGADRW